MRVFCGLRESVKLSTMHGRKTKKEHTMKIADCFDRVLVLYEEHKERGLTVCDITLIPDFFDCTSVSITARKVERIINLMLKEEGTP